MGGRVKIVSRDVFDVVKGEMEAKYPISNIKEYYRKMLKRHKKEELKRHGIGFSYHHREPSQEIQNLPHIKFLDTRDGKNTIDGHIYYGKNRS
jgi:hypothetical protein